MKTPDQWMTDVRQLFSLSPMATRVTFMLPSLEEFIRRVQTDVIANPPMPTSHSGDCTIYSALLNGRQEDGICTCGYGAARKYKGDFTQMFSLERRNEMRGRLQRSVEAEQKRQKAHPKDIHLDDCPLCGAPAIHPSMRHCMKCGQTSTRSL